MASPYDDLPRTAFWRSGVAERAPLDPGPLYTPRVRVAPKTRVATAGSCFAQHLGQALSAAGVSVVDAEPVADDFPQTEEMRRGYRLFSARYGNIYTAAQWVQLIREAEGMVAPADPVWEKGGRYFDAQRLSLDPEGFDTPEDVLRHREHHLERVRWLLRNFDVLVFTLGLTEHWEHIETETVYPMAPGVLAGRFAPEIHRHVMADANSVLRDLEAARKLMRKINRKIRIILTVSPVPLTATASGLHVEVANSLSKSTLRAAAGMMTARHSDVDYMPSYEVITSANARGAYFDANNRTVSPAGIARVMDLFLGAQGLSPAHTTPLDTHCDETLLEAFSA